MKKNEEYWLQLYKDGKIEIDFENGIVYSWLSGKKHIVGGKKSRYAKSTAGTNRKERYDILLHRLIWICKYGDIPEKIDINHKNGDKRDNRICNLELNTRSENLLHACRNLGYSPSAPRGERNGSAKLSYEKAEKMRELYKTGDFSKAEIGRMFGVGRSQARKVIANLYWNKENY